MHAGLYRISAAPLILRERQATCDGDPMDTFEFSARSVLLDPFVLRCAWNKLQDWYANAPWEPLQEWSEWLLDPWPRMVSVARSLADRTYRPAPFQLVPYPKDGGVLRHYARPSVADQFAFLVLGTVLTPLLEARFSSISYGGRWYRRIRPSSGENSWQFELQPFTLGDERIYQTYSRSYGLFRRVAAWTARRMLRLPVDRDVTTGPVQRETDYPNTALPYKDIDASGTAAHARIDLRAAFPCVDRALLRKRLIALLHEPLSFESFPFHTISPWPALELNPHVAVELAHYWCDLLELVRYEAGPVASLWRPDLTKNPEVQLPVSESDLGGLPTGLAVSSVLFNVYLHYLDRNMLQACGSDSAFLRFVDDMVLLAPNTERLLGLIETVLTLLRAPENTNLCIGFQKTRPAALGAFLVKAARPGATSFVDALAQASSGTQEEVRRATTLSEDNLGPFVTFLVERMSDLGSPTIHDLFGDQVGQRLAQLHEMVYLGMDDEEVRSDTRLAFAAARMARAPIAGSHVGIASSPEDVSETGQRARDERGGVEAIAERLTINRRRATRFPARRPLAVRAG